MFFSIFFIDDMRGTPSKFVELRIYSIVKVTNDKDFIASFNNVSFFSQWNLVILSFIHFLTTKAV